MNPRESAERPAEMSSEMPSGQEEMERVLMRLIGVICKHPDRLVVKKLPNPADFTMDLDTYCVQADPVDVGRVIGRTGLIVNALQTIATAAALMRGERQLILRVLNPRRTDRRMEGG